MGDEEVSKDHIIQEQEMTIKAYQRELKELHKLLKEDARLDCNAMNLQRQGKIESLCSLVDYLTREIRKGLKIEDTQELKDWLKEDRMSWTY